MNARFPHHREHGFTLMEMIVVLIVLGIAMAAIFPAIGNMMRSNSRTAAVSQASAEAEVAARMLEYDIRRALGNRGTGDRTDVTTNLATIPALANNQANPSYADIVQASPTVLVLNSDVYPQNAGIERVEWSLLTNNDACGDRSTSNTNWCLQRRVLSQAGGVVTTEIPVKGRGTYPINSTTCAPSAGPALQFLPALNAPRVFCYREATPRVGNTAGAANQYRLNGWTPNCESVWLNNGPNTGNMTLATRLTTEHNRVDPLASISRLDRIVSINATILAGGAVGRSGELSYEHVSASIRAREGETYREAIMCGTRGRWGQ